MNLKYYPNFILNWKPNEKTKYKYDKWGNVIEEIREEYRNKKKPSIEKIKTKCRQHPPLLVKSNPAYTTYTQLKFDK